MHGNEKATIELTSGVVEAARRKQRSSGAGRTKATEAQQQQQQQQRRRRRTTTTTTTPAGHVAGKYEGRAAGTRASGLAGLLLSSAAALGCLSLIAQPSSVIQLTWASELHGGLAAASGAGASGGAGESAASLLAADGSAGSERGADLAAGPPDLDELNSMVQQHAAEADATGNQKKLAEAIFARFMGDQLEGLELPESGASELLAEGGSLADGGQAGYELPAEVQPSGRQRQWGAGDAAQEPASRLKKLLGWLQRYELADAESNNPMAAVFPTLPASQAATMKRAAMRMMKQQQQRHSPYSRASFDFGLGKRVPEGGSGRAPFAYRFGDLLDGQPLPVSQFGKRPSAHRFDFGLGKRLASPAYPRFDFGLGKRAHPNRLRFDFGLGR